MHNARDVLATTALVGSAYFYVSYRSHDRRALSDDEVAHAREELARVTPSPTPSTSASCASRARDALVASHTHNLSKFGATVVKHVLSPHQLVEWNTRAKKEFDAGQNIVWNSGRAHCSISDRSVHYSEMIRVSSNCDNDVGGSNNGDNGSEGRNSSWLVGFWSRRRGGSNKTSVNAETLPLVVSLQHIVQSYFKQHGIERYTITQLQFLNAFPESSNQIWHRDNKFRGLTAIVALQDIRGNGPTELILGSHQQNFSLWPICWNVIHNYLRNYLPCDMDGDDSFSNLPLLGCIDAGDAILYDARIFHRGRGNKSLEAEGNVGRPVLVLRWDASNTPPPGAGLIVTSANRYLGSLIYAILFALQKIPASSDEIGSDYQ